jgi:multiple sugar transport system substrate-binding protein
MTVRLTGLTWDHPRGYLVLDALAGTLEPDVSVRWRRQPLEGFESRPLRTLADDFDLLVVDHPGLGEAVRDGALLPLDEVFGQQELAAWRAASVGASYDSYLLDGRPWALPLDAAAQVAVARPDLMDTRPGSWEQAGQAARAYPTTLCLGGPHALLMFSAICVAAGSPPAVAPAGTGPAGTGSAAADGPFVNEAAGTAALAVMADLLACADRELSQRNPIGVLDAMAAGGGPAYCPLVYGYVTYQRPLAGEPGSTRLAAFGAPAGRGGIGSVLGGTGLAVTRSAVELGAAAALVRTLLSDEVQVGLYAELGGQSSARLAWEHPGADAAGGGFYRSTLATVEQAWVRPRFAGYPEFQTAASAVLREGLLAGEAPARLVRRVNELFAAARDGGSRGPATPGSGPAPRPGIPDEGTPHRSGAERRPV